MTDHEKSGEVDGFDAVVQQVSQNAHQKVSLIQHSQSETKLCCSGIFTIFFQIKGNRGLMDDDIWHQNVWDIKIHSVSPINKDMSNLDVKVKLVI